MYFLASPFYTLAPPSFFMKRTLTLFLLLLFLARFLHGWNISIQRIRIQIQVVAGRRVVRQGGCRCIWRDLPGPWQVRSDGEIGPIPELVAVGVETGASARESGTDELVERMTFVLVVRSVGGGGGGGCSSEKRGPPRQADLAVCHVGAVGEKEDELGPG